MKKFLMIMAAALCIAIGANAKTKYFLTVSTQIVYEFYDEKGNVAGFKTEAGSSYATTICAETPDQAKQAAKSECSTACCSAERKNEGIKQHNGKYYQCYSTRRVLDVVCNVKTGDGDC
jgi:hypothetical protein